MSIETREVYVYAISSSIMILPTWNWWLIDRPSINHWCRAMHKVVICFISWLIPSPFYLSPSPCSHPTLYHLGWHFSHKFLLHELLQVASFCLQLVGCALVGVGIWTMVDKNFTTLAENNSLDFLQYAGIIMISIGSVIMVIGFFGCCGAIRESQCLLTMVTSLSFTTRALLSPPPP